MHVPIAAHALLLGSDLTPRNYLLLTPFRYVRHISSSSSSFSTTKARVERVKYLKMN